MRSGLAAVGDHAAQADALRVTQAAISHQIEALEDRLRVSLSSPLADWQDPPTNVVQRSWAPGQPDRRLLQQNGGSPRYNAVMYLEHIALALTIQILVGRLTGNWWAGAALASAYFVGREVTQAEYRWIELYGGPARQHALGGVRPAGLD